MVVHIQNLHKGMKVTEIHAKMISEQMFMVGLFTRRISCGGL